MRILFIRHGVPNYVKDKLTEKGRREMSPSPFLPGSARHTAAATDTDL